LGRGAASGARTASGGPPVRRVRSRALAPAAVAAALLAGCGGPARQDEDEPVGRYNVEVVEADFPSSQKLAKSSRMTIGVRNVDTKTIPNVAVTIGTQGGPSASQSGFAYRDEGNEDPSKPIFVIDTYPRGGDTAYTNTWALGQLKPGQTKTFNWDVTAVEARPFNIRYKIAAGLDGKAVAVTETGEQPAGRFTGTVDDTPPDAKVADTGRDIIKADGVVAPRNESGE
jgi:hypothetical protein